MNFLKDIGYGAIFSDDRKYRYALWRIWKDGPIAMCIGLNPSNANASKNDPTISNLIKMLGSLGFGGFYMMNLFAFVSSKPKELLTCDNPLGENDKYLSGVSAVCDDVIFCWGAFKETEKRTVEIIEKFPDAKCFGLNKDGSPFHPLAMMYKGLTNKPELHYFDFHARQCANDVLIF